MNLLTPASGLPSWPSQPPQGTAIVLEMPHSPGCPSSHAGSSGVFLFAFTSPRASGPEADAQHRDLTIQPGGANPPSHTTSVPPTPRIHLLLGRDVDQCIPDRFCFFCSVPLGLILLKKKSLNMKAGKCFKKTPIRCIIRLNGHQFILLHVC